MAAIVNIPLAGATVTYNGVQFGGSDSEHKSVPPTYRFSGRFKRDDAGIAVVGTVYTLIVSTTFYHNTSEGNLAAIVEDVRLKLAQTGKTLKIEGLGTAFGTIEHDEEWGPKPISFDWSPYGIHSWQCTWVVEFFIKECSSEHSAPLALTAFNFSTTWQNDYEGLCERTISGYVEIAVYNNQGVASHVADEVRESINVICPSGFRRVRNVWREGATKNRLDFIIIDELLPGTPLPPGCIHASGDITFQSQGPGFAQGTVSLYATVRVIPTAHPALAGVILLAIANTKFQQMLGNIGPKGAVIPNSITISNHKFDNARETVFQMTWIVTKCIKDMLPAVGIWEPLVTNSHEEWKASVQDLWVNRGAAIINGGKIGSDPSEAVVIDMCTQAGGVNIGRSGVTPNYPNATPNYQFACNPIPADGGWIFHDLRLRIFRKDEQSWHKKATTYNPEPGSVSSSSSSLADVIPLGGFPYFQDSEETKSDVEFHGLPEVYILMQFRALRTQHKPAVPEIKTIGGLPVTQVAFDIQPAFIAWDALACPVWGIRGWRVYRVNGYVASIKATESESSCTASNGSLQDY